jgi:protein-export membrane protein SecF
MMVKDRSKICLICSCAIMVIALVLSLFGQGINMGIDFSGGLNIKYQMNAAFEQADVDTALENAGIKVYTVTAMGENNSDLQIRIKDTTEEDIQVLRESIETELLAKYPDMDVANAAVGYVGPVAGATLVRNAVFSVLIASLLMLVYIAFRFDLPSGLAAVIGLVHDVLMMLSFMVILRNIIQMNSSFIAAMLTIVGYSINNTIVIFDRVRENKKANPSMGGVDVANKSVKESLGRTINTTLTTLITITTLYIIGVEAIREFALPIIIGILSGVYSANMINPYVWAKLQNTIKPGRKLKAKKA